MDKPLRPDDCGYDPHEMLGRYLENPLGSMETVVLKQVWWDYFDWLGRRGFKTRALMRNCYRRKPHLPISEAMTWQLWHVAWSRQEKGLRQPKWLLAAPPPPGYEHF